MWPAIDSLTWDPASMLKMLPTTIISDHYYDIDEFKYYEQMLQNNVYHIINI